MKCKRKGGKRILQGAHLDFLTATGIFGLWSGHFCCIAIAEEHLDQEIRCKIVSRPAGGNSQIKN